MRRDSVHVPKPIQNLSTLTSLKILSIQSNRLTELKGLESLQSLEELYIADNFLTGISSLEGNKQLRVLDISRNQIQNLRNIRHLTHIEEFWASSNQLDSFGEIESELNDKEELNTVYFEGNPIQTKNAVTYRNKMHLCLPRVKQIDASKFSCPTSWCEATKELICAD